MSKLLRTQKRDAHIFSFYKDWCDSCHRTGQEMDRDMKTYLCWWPKRRDQRYK